MRRFREPLLSTLRWKIALAVFIVMLIAGGAFVYVAQKTGSEMLVQQGQLKARSIGGILSGYLEHTMLEGGKDHAHGTLVSLTRSPEIFNAYLLKADGSVSISADPLDTIVHFPVNQLEEALGAHGEKYLSTTEHNRLYEYVFLPMYNKHECSTCHNDDKLLRGYFGVKLDVDDVQSIALEHRNSNIIMTLVTFVSIGVIIYFALSVLIIRPVGTLHSYIKKVETKITQLEAGEKTTFPLLSEPDSKDEIAELTRDVNKLIRRLNEANEKLLEMHHLQLDHAAKLASVGEMAASMAHEIKNPIAGVFGAVQIFESELQPGDPRKEIFSEMRVQLERVNHAVTDLLSFARPTPPVFEDVELNDIILRTCSMLTKQLNERNVTLLNTLNGEPVSIRADKKQLQQVFWNILLNAIQSMEKSGTLTISSERYVGAIVISVRDTGKGIPPDCLKEIFKPFFTTKHKGTGLGMTITKRIVEQHHGNISVSSIVGEGTVVSIQLPNTRKEM